MVSLSQPTSYVLHGHCCDLELVFLAVSHHFLVEAPGFFLRLEFVDGVVSQVLERLHPLFGDAEGQEGLFGGFALGFGFGLGFHLRETYNVLRITILK